MQVSSLDEVLQCINKVGGKKLLNRFQELCVERQQLVAMSVLKHKRSCEKMKVSITLQCLKQIIEMIEKDEIPYRNDDFDVIPGMKTDKTDTSSILKLHRTPPAIARRSSSHALRSSSLGSGNFYT